VRRSRRFAEVCSAVKGEFRGHRSANRTIRPEIDLSATHGEETNKAFGAGINRSHGRVVNASVRDTARSSRGSGEPVRRTRSTNSSSH